MFSEQPVSIRVSNLTKCYEIYNSPVGRLKQFILPRLKRLFGFNPGRYYREFYALKNISFEVKRGQTVGIIGRNGSGKSTLLQIICGTLTPTQGTVEIRGRVAALLELGSGFNPEFSGRENVYMNAALLGLSSSETDARFDEIINFADIGEFIDQPVKTYSSGMMVRLAFAVIAHVNADILVVDEALAVGDTFFTQKCMRFIRQFQKGGGTLLFVSHDMSMLINICDSGIMLFPGGQPAVLGSAEDLCKDYLNQIYEDPDRRKSMENHRISRQIEEVNPGAQNPSRQLHGQTQGDCEYLVSTFNKSAESFGDGGAQIVNAGFYNSDHQLLSKLKGGESVLFIITVKTCKDIFSPVFGIMLKDRLGQYLFTEGTDKPFRNANLNAKNGDLIHVAFQFTMPFLIRGVYTFNIAVAEGDGDDHIQHHWIHDAVKIECILSPVVHGINGFPHSKMTIDFVSADQMVKL